jgi:methylated-DNA-[protein]-cysteine S-methyltransferase
MTPWHTVSTTDLGDLVLVRDAASLPGVYFPRHWHRPDPTALGPRIDRGFEDVTGQLDEYLAGRRRRFELDLAPVGDAFERSVWDLVARIPYGETATYGDLAATIGGAVTAQGFGAAVGRNPLSIVVPCHRVIGRNGKLTGYAGGLARKRHLLDVEHDQTSAIPTLWDLRELRGRSVHPA